MTDRRSDPHPDSPLLRDNRDQERVDPDIGADIHSDVEGHSVTEDRDAPDATRDPSRPPEPRI